jgi:hypothetical protein
MNTIICARASLAWLGLLSAGALAAAEPDAAERVTRAAEGFAKEHPADELRDPRTLQEQRTLAADVQSKPRAASGRASIKAATPNATVYGDTWIYEATVTLFADLDADGYAHYVRVRFDADSIYDPATVYAELYLSADGDSWELLYTTKDFTVLGRSPDDDYEVETELVSGYPAGKYDLLIELHDAADGTLLDEFGPDESADLSLLPLEDSTRDGVVVEPPPAHHHGGGALGWLALPGLAAALFARRRERRSVR